MTNRTPRLLSISAHRMVSLVGHMNFSHAEVGGVMGGGKNMYGDYSQVSMSQCGMFPGRDSHVYFKLVSRAYVCQYARVRTYGLHAAVDHRVDLLSVCTTVEYSITGKRRAVHSAAHGTWYLSRTLRSSDMMLTVSLCLLTLLAFSLAFKASE